MTHGHNVILGCGGLGKKLFLEAFLLTKSMFRAQVLDPASTIKLAWNVCVNWDHVLFLVACLMCRSF
jgi:hypothetical protein